MHRVYLWSLVVGLLTLALGCGCARQAPALPDEAQAALAAPPPPPDAPFAADSDLLADPGEKFRTALKGALSGFRLVYTRSDPVDYKVALIDVMATDEPVSAGVGRDAVLAPNGKTVAVLRDDEAPGPALNLVVRSLGGRGETVVARPVRAYVPLAGAVQPVWSPDSRRVAMTAYPDGLVLVDASSGGAHLVQRLGETLCEPAWSPDATRIAFRSVDAVRSRIGVANADGSDVRLVSAGSNLDALPCWSPDAAWIAFVQGERKIMRVRADGAPEEEIAGSAGRILALSWSPDGARIASVENRGSTGALVLHDVASRNEWTRAALPGGLSHARLSWSPDGAKLAVRACHSPAEALSHYVLDTSAPDMPLLPAPGESGAPGPLIWLPER